VASDTSDKVGVFVVHRCSETNRPQRTFRYLRNIQFSRHGLHADVIFWPDEVPVLEASEVHNRSGWREDWKVSFDDIEKLVQKHFVDPMASIIVQIAMGYSLGLTPHGVAEHWNVVMRQLGYVHISDRED